MNSDHNHLRYGTRSNGGEHGSVMTKPEIVKFMLDVSGYTPQKDLSQVKVLEPAAGEGAFFLSCIDRLFQSSQKFKFDFVKHLNNLTAIELDEHRCLSLRQKTSQLLISLGIINPSRILSIIIRREDYLLSDLSSYDLIIGNPPYVRWDNIPQKQRKIYSTRFQCFRDRSDLYIAFYEKSLNSLSRDGQLCFICSDRWMKNTYGKSLRALVGSSFSVPLVLNMNNADAFEEKVIGYPSITLITRAYHKDMNYAEAKSPDSLKILSKSVTSGHKSVPGIVQTPRPYGSNPWVFDPSYRSLNRNDFETIENQGFKIGIGVATGRDSVYVGNDLHRFVEPELLLPLAKSGDIKNGKLEWQGSYVINVFDKQGQLIDINRFPKLSSYFYSKKADLLRRHVAKKNPSSWFRTIDKIDKSLVQAPKLLMADIKKGSQVIYDDGRFYPHHNLYYLTCKSHQELKVMGAILMSDFVMQQLAQVSTLMHGGFVRWQSQNLRRLLIPRISEMPSDLKQTLISAYKSGDLAVINKELNNYVTKLASRTENMGLEERSPRTSFQTRIPVFEAD